MYWSALYLVKSACGIGDVLAETNLLETGDIQRFKSPGTLVIEINTSTGKQEIRGMFSSTHISKMLGRNIYEPLHAAHSLADMQHELGH